VLLVASGAIVWRVLKPAEVVTMAIGQYPAAGKIKPGAVGSLVNAPLIVDGRIRVYADMRQIRADNQPGYKYEKSPFWSYRRWPAQLLGVVHPQTASDGVPVIAGSWSDGELVALDGRSGAVLWRTKAEVLGGKYAGRRTGSNVVWSPPGLLTGMADRAVIATAGNGQVSVYAARDGERLWTAQTPICLEQAFTASGALIAPDTCVAPHSLIRFDLTTGTRTEHPLRGFNDKLTVTPLGCRVGRSECGGVRFQAPNHTAGWLITTDGFTKSVALGSVTALLAGDTVVDSGSSDSADTRAIVGRDARTGASLWTYRQSTPMRLLATTTDRVLVVSGRLKLTALDPRTGDVISSHSIGLRQDRAPYVLGTVYTSGPYVAIVRLKPNADASGTDDEYYFTARPVLLAMS
jgi:outer membrane protein assembly factor BamB